MRHHDMRQTTTMLRALSIVLAGFLLQAACLADGPAFDAASVKLFGPDVPKVTLFSGGPGSGDPGRLHLRVNMSLLLGAAFGVSVDQIKGPGWLRDFATMPFYDITAVMPPDTTKIQVEKMLRNLLIERFHLIFHQETGNSPGYELVADKGGPMVKEQSEDIIPDPDPQAMRSAPTGADGFPVLPGARVMGSRGSTVHQRIKYQEWSMKSFATDLGFKIGRSQGKSVDDGSFQPRVVDKTGLAGTYTFILEYDCPACAPLAAPLSANSDGGNSSAPIVNEPGGFPDIFVAVQKELGLKLIKTAGVAMDLIVVEAIDKTPTEN
jgi:uncharacterized protein (TIGR03435 family)